MAAGTCTKGGWAIALTALALTSAATAAPRSHWITDAQVKRMIIADSIRASGSACPCPYSKTRKGKACGSRSLYNQPGGYPPQCYPKDVTEQDVEAYRNEHGLGGR